MKVFRFRAWEISRERYIACFGIRGDEIFVERDGCHFWDDLADYIPEQYTGLKEISEGDICKIFHKSKTPQSQDINVTGVIIYQESCSRFVLKTRSELIRFGDYLSELEIIGNIHKNPELMS